jgi:hypothetical protein
VEGHHDVGSSTKAEEEAVTWQVAFAAARDQTELSELLNAPDYSTMNLPIYTAPFLAAHSTPTPETPPSPPSPPAQPPPGPDIVPPQIEDPPAAPAHPNRIREPGAPPPPAAWI